MSTRRRSTMLIVAIGAAALLAACAEDSVTGSTAGSTPDAPADATVGIADPTSPGTLPAPAITTSITTPFEGSTPVSSDQIDPGLKPFIDLAVIDLAKRLSVDAADVGVTSATLVQWPDASLGCAQPGLQYAQVSTDGALIVLTANSKAYEYHAGGSRTPFLCEPQPKPTPTTGPGL